MINIEDKYRFLKQQKLPYSLLSMARGGINAMLPDKTRKKVFMMHTGRVGSTVVADLLNQHPKVHWDGEIYPKRRDYYKNSLTKDSIDFLKFKMRQQRKPVYGFELKSANAQMTRPQSVNYDLKSFIRQIEKIGFEYFILIERKNYLRQYISLHKARESKIHHTLQDVKNYKKIVFDPKNCHWFHKTTHLCEHFKYLDRFYENTAELLASKNRLHLIYEDDILPNPEAAYQKISDFLDLKPRKPEIRLKRTNPFSIEEMTDNYSAVAQALNATKYEWMLHD